MKLIIIRHGETEQNVKKIMQGQIHGKLTKKGINQAKSVARKFKNEKIDAIYSSDLRRAVHTTREIAKFHKVPIYYTKELRERNAGIFNGRHSDHYHVAQKNSGLPNIAFRAKGGESTIDTKRRLERFSKKLNKEYKDKTVLLVTHGIAIKCLASIYLGMPLDKASELSTKNTGVLIIKVQKPKNKKLLDQMFKKDKTPSYF